MSDQSDESINGRHWNAGIVLREMHDTKTSPGLAQEHSSSYSGVACIRQKSSRYMRITELRPIQPYYYNACVA